MARSRLLGASVYERKERLAARADARREAMLKQAGKRRRRNYPPPDQARAAVMAASETD